MIHFCDEIARNIRSAKTTGEIDEIILESFPLFVLRRKASHPGSLVMNMIVTLGMHRAEACDSHELSNVDYAITVYQEQQINRATQLF